MEVLHVGANIKVDGHVNFIWASRTIIAELNMNLSSKKRWLVIEIYNRVQNEENIDSAMAYLNQPETID
jgi:hypothetical protein